MSERSIGISTKQIIDCPKDSVYIVPRYVEIEYYKRIAALHNRNDIRFESRGFLENKRYLGFSKHIVLDHRTSFREYTNMWKGFVDQHNECIASIKSLVEEPWGAKYDPWEV